MTTSAVRDAASAGSGATCVDSTAPRAAGSSDGSSVRAEGAALSMDSSAPRIERSEPRIDSCAGTTSRIARTAPRTYTIKEVAALTGLPASTLRYYETVGIIPPISRGKTSGHRVYTQSDVDLLSWVSCLAATGMGIDKMREYIANGEDGARRASGQVELLQAQDAELAREAERIAVRRQYIALKIAYWQAVEHSDQARAEELADQAAALAAKLH